MNCIYCNSNRVVHFTGRCKCKDMNVTVPHLNISVNGYSLTDLFGLSDVGLDYMSFGYCLDCMKIQADTISDERIIDFFSFG